MQHQKMRRMTFCLAFFVMFLLGITINSNNVQAATGKEFTENGILYWDYGDGQVCDIEQGIIYRYKSSSKTYTVEDCLSQNDPMSLGGTYHIEASSEEVRTKYVLAWYGFDGNIVIPATIKGKKVTAIGDAAFYPSGDRIKTVAIGKNVTSIGKESFQNCVGLTTVTLSDSVQKIGEWAFAGSTITSISIGKNVKSIGQWAFSNCTKLETVTFAKGKLTSLPRYCFNRCTSLKEIVLSTKLTSLSESCFTECTALEEVVLPSSVTKLGDSVFTLCTKLKKVTIKGKLKTIPSGCFAGCKSLEGFQIPSTVKTIKDRAFSGCTLLTEIKIPSSMKTITSYAFADSCLEKISIPSTVTTIKKYAFSNCKNLYQVTCTNVNTIEKYAFYNCKNLYQVVFTKGTTKIKSDTFRGCDMTRLTIVAPKNSMTYRTYTKVDNTINPLERKPMLAINTKFGFNINSNLMVAGEEKQFAAKNYSGTLKWKSSNSSVLKITSSGMATAKKVGTVTLTATADTQKFTFKIKVLKRTMDNVMKVITTEYARPEMSDFEKAYGAFWYLVTNVEYDYDTYEADEKGNWKNKNMDSYAAKGALENGLAVCDGYAKAFKQIMDYYGIPCKRVISEERNHAWNAIEIDGKWYYVDATWGSFIYGGKNVTQPDNFSEKTYSYTTVNTTSRTKSANSSVKVAGLTVNPYLSATKTTLTVGGNNKFTLKLTGAKVKSFTSTKTSVATVSKKGVITAKKKGTATIKVKTANGKTYSCKVTVDNPKINKTTLKLNKGKTYTLQVTGTSQTITWKSANTKVATITAKGKVKAVGKGSTKITTSVNGKKLTCTVTVHTVHTHSYTETVTKAATCTSKGTTKYTCSCGDSYTKTIAAALGHNYQWKVTKKASTTAAKSTSDFGTRVLTCKNCSDKKQTETIINVNGKLIYGYFDENGAVLLQDAVNKARTYFGVSGGTLLPIDELEEAAKLEVVKYVCTYDNQALHSGGDAIYTSDYKGIACCTGAAYDYVAEQFRQGASSIFMNVEAKNIATACFYYAVGEYNSDGSGGSYKLYHMMLLK